jgi:hypothetical protein
MRMNRLVKIGCTLLALGTGPLLLYVIFGPKDGNPIGLGLLFFFSFPAAMACLAIGGVQHVLAKRGQAGPGGSAGAGGTGRLGPLQGRSPGATRGRRVPEESGDPGHWSP